MTEWASSQAKLLLSDIEIQEKQQHEDYLYRSSQNNTGFHPKYGHPRTDRNGIHGANASDVISSTKGIDYPGHQEEAKEEEQVSDSNVQNESTSKAFDFRALSGDDIIAGLFGKKLKKNENGNLLENDGGNEDDTSSIGSDETSFKTNDNANSTDEAHNRKLEALRQRISKMGVDTKSCKSLKGVAKAVLFIEYLKEMRRSKRPAVKEEFQGNLNAMILDKKSGDKGPCTKLTCNLLKMYSSSVFRSIHRSKITLVGYALNKPTGILGKLWKGRDKEPNEDSTMFIRVHVLKLLNTLNEYFKNVPKVLMDFFNGYLLHDDPALFKYLWVNEAEHLHWDEFKFVRNYTEKQKRMILLNYCAVRCLLQEVMFPAVEQESYGRGRNNLLCIASVYYYIIRAYNSQILGVDMIKKDEELGGFKDKLLKDDHTIYQKLNTLIQDGKERIERFMDYMMEKVQNERTTDSLQSGGHQEQ